MRKSATSASVTFTANEYGTLYYKVLPETETAPESIDTTGEGIQVEVGENTLELTDITDAAYKVYMVLKDSDSTPKTSEMLTVRVASVEELLAPAKEAAITELNVYKNAEDYRDAEKTQITKILANAKVLINNAKTAEEIAEQLSDAKADLDKLKTSAELAADEKTQTDADAVKALIEALGDVTLEKKESVEAARNAYDALSTDAKKLVSNYDVLVQAEKTIQTLEAKKQQEELKNQMDAAAAASVSSAITAIEEVTLDKRGVVEAARAAYNTLTEDQKALVTNYTDLLDVARLAWIFNLEANQEISKERIYAAALLHDIGRHIQYENGTPHQIAGLPIAEQILTDCGFYPEEMKEILYAIENHRNKEMLKRDDLAGILYRADKMSRCCFGCRAEKECNWSTEKKNMEIQY